MIAVSTVTCAPDCRSNFSMICVAISPSIRIAYSALPEGFDLSRPDAIAEVIEQALRKSGIPAEASEVLSHLKIDLPTAQLSAAIETLVIVLQ